MPVNCGDTVVDYLTLKEKKNLLRLQIKFEQLKSEVEYLREAGKTDSVYIDKLQGYLAHMDSVIDLCEQGAMNYNAAYEASNTVVKSLQKEIKRQKIKSWIGGVLGGMGAFGAGVGITFLILKL